MKEFYRFQRNKVIIFLFILSYFLLPHPAYAHAFGATYRFPIPFSLYLVSGALALFLSFLLIGIFSAQKKVGSITKTYTLSTIGIVRILTSALSIKIYQSISMFLFLLTIITGLVGDELSAFNFNMTFFWVVFVIGFTYLTFFIGNVWETVNPWRLLVAGYERLSHTDVGGIIGPPPWLGYYPALILYFLFIGIELFVGTSPFMLSVVLLQYTFVTLFAVVLFGKQYWFTYGEFFSVFFRFISFTSIVTTRNQKILLRLPFTGLLEQKTSTLSALLFILFMLSSTAFDGFRETNAWFDLYWNRVALFGGVFAEQVGYHIFEWVGLAVSPFIFLALYQCCIFLMKRLTNAKQSVLQLSLLFAFTLIPIALVYNIAHYFTLLLLQGQMLIRLISDPFGWGWNLFGTSGFVPALTMLPASFVWHFQVVLILTGHIVSVYLAHIIALRVFRTRKIAMLSQLPLLILMITYTLIGLWILSQPIGTS